MNSPDTSTAKLPRLEHLERLLDARQLDPALNELHEILVAIDRNHGDLTGVLWIPTNYSSSFHNNSVQFATRFIAAWGRLICDPEFSMTAGVFERLQQFSRWIEVLTSLSGFDSADSFARRLGEDTPVITIGPNTVLRFLSVYLPSSSIDLPFDVLRNADPAAFYVTALNWLGSRYCFRKEFFDRREALLEWIPGKLQDVTLGEITLANVSEPYFHVSYAFTSQKHAVKADLISQLRQCLLKNGCLEWSPSTVPSLSPSSDAKPTIVVTAEYINRGHSIHRTHSRSLRSLRRKFRVIGVCKADDAHQALGDLFDEVIPFPEDQSFFAGVKQLADKILGHRPAVVLHLSVGMRNQVIALAALRLAPIQCLSYGHMATTNSPAIDYMILPADFVGDDTCFSERLIKLPPEAMPYEPRLDIDYVGLRRAVSRLPKSDRIEIAVPGTIMKLNPTLFETLRRIRDTALRPCHFTFFTGFAHGLAFAELSKQITLVLPDATVNPNLYYQKYCEELAKCEFTLNPFPYGNMNTVMESVALGLPGVCLDGAESHAHTDGAIYARLGLPACLNTQSIDDYVTQAVRLIDDGDWLAHCRDLATRAPFDAKFYEGDESLFCDAVYNLIPST